MGRHHRPVWKDVSDQIDASGEALAASALPPGEPQGHCERSRLATCSPAVVDAEALEQWLTDRIAALQKERETAHKCNVYSHAERCKNYAAAYEAVKLEIRRRMGRASERQPQENDEDDSRRARSARS